MPKKVLSILSNHGYWGVELTGPMVKLEAAGYELVFATPKGERPVALPPSYDVQYWDPPLGCRGTTPEDAAQVEAVKDSPKLDDPIDLSTWFPERPYYSKADFLRALEAYYRRLRELDLEGRAQHRRGRHDLRPPLAQPGLHVPRRGPEGHAAHRPRRLERCD